MGASNTVYVTPLVIAIAAALLSLERVCYVWAWRQPDSFRRMALRLRIAKDGMSALERCFYAFKLIQAGVFATWCFHFNEGAGIDFTRSVPAILGGIVLIAGGQILNLAAIVRLGRVGTFYGIRFGHVVPRCRKFPYSVIAHPQYVGAVVTIWGIFLLLRFPHPDWFVLPGIESIFYCAGALLEQERGRVAAPSQSTEQKAVSGTS